MSHSVHVHLADEVSIVLCGAAGSGVQTVEQLLVKLIKQAGFHVFATKEYMSRVRGGLNSVTIRVASHPVRAAVDRMDILIPLTPGAVEHVRDRLDENTLILSEPEFLDETIRAEFSNILEVPFTRMAREIGNKLYANTVAIGLIGTLLGLSSALMHEVVAARFAGGGETLVDGNLAALEKGCSAASACCAQGQVAIAIRASDAMDEQMIVSGVEAVGMGAIAAGCNFIGAYPMSPSTGLLQFLARHAEAFDIVVEQAEDEIAGINMAIGAWYAGARAIASTSGGGFALMTEGLSLAGMIESPLVIHIAQRPGPATGLPTRTGQEDLNLALYAGHGEFPRVILAPGTLQEAFDLTVHAFDLADRYQVPVFILTDQYFVDTYYNTARFDVSSVEPSRSIVETSAGYRRFELTEDGLSPRGIPGFGNGLVVVDSDEHDEAGHITEDLKLRELMVNKRLNRQDLLEAAALAPTVWPGTDYRTLVVCWGSTRPVVQEALALLGRDDVAMLHVTQLFPLAEEVYERLDRAERIICLEGNATGQFAALLATYTGFDADDCVLKYNGLQWTVEQAAGSIRAILEQEAD